MERANTNMSLLFVACILAIYIASVSSALAYGKSSEDLIGVFSIQKTIKLGSSSECFSGLKEASDPLSMQNTALTEDQSPGITSFSIEPKIVKASSPQPINLTAHIMADQSGLSNASSSDLLTAWFVSPSGRQAVNVTLDSRNIIAGNKPDGICSGKIMMPKDSEIGTWHIDNLTLEESNGNRKRYGNDQIRRLGFPEEFVVI